MKDVEEKQLTGRVRAKILEYYLGGASPKNILEDDDTLWDEGYKTDDIQRFLDFLVVDMGCRSSVPNIIHDVRVVVECDRKDEHGERIQLGVKDFTFIELIGGIASSWFMGLNPGEPWRVRFLQVWNVYDDGNVEMTRGFHVLKMKGRSDA